jgi:pimeloyl-CoA dehydrogenase small subunit
MDFSLSTEQQLLKDSVDRFIQDDYTFETRREIIASDAGFSAEVWSTFAELGWLGIPFAEELGGFAGTPVETLIVMEGIGRGLVLEPYLATVVLGGGAVAAGGSQAQKEALLPALVEGKLKLALAYAEPQSRFNLNDVATSARKADGGYVLDGHKSVVFHAAAADRIVVSARTAGDRRDEGGITLFLVDGGADGLTRRNYPTVDGLRASDLTLAGVKVGADAVIGEVDDGLALLDQVIDRATAAVCAEALGAMGALHAVTGEYLKTRQQFGRPIGDFQVLQHRMVDMFIACEQSRSMTYMATLKLDADAAERSKSVSAAKVQIGKAGRFVGQQAVQLHGGMGMTDELNVGHYFKRLTMIDTLFGNTDHHLDRFASL